MYADMPKTLPSFLTYFD